MQAARWPPAPARPSSATTASPASGPRRGVAGSRAGAAAGPAGSTADRGPLGAAARSQPTAPPPARPSPPPALVYAAAGPARSADAARRAPEARPPLSAPSAGSSRRRPGPRPAGPRSAVWPSSDTSAPPFAAGAARTVATFSQTKCLYGEVLLV